MSAPGFASMRNIEMICKREFTFLPRHPARSFEASIRSPHAGIQGRRCQKAGAKPNGKQQEADDRLVHKEHGVGTRRHGVQKAACRNGGDCSKEHCCQGVVEEPLDATYERQQAQPYKKGFMFEYLILILFFLCLSSSS